MVYDPIIAHFTQLRDHVNTLEHSINTSVQIYCKRLSFGRLILECTTHVDHVYSIPSVFIHLHQTAHHKHNKMTNFTVFCDTAGNLV